MPYVARLRCARRAARRGCKGVPSSAHALRHPAPCSWRLTLRSVAFYAHAIAHNSRAARRAARCRTEGFIGRQPQGLAVADALCAPVQGETHRSRAPSHVLTFMHEINQSCKGMTQHDVILANSNAFPKGVMHMIGPNPSFKRRI